jgi:hypothetical protein
METPDVFASDETQGFIRTELARPAKQWVHEVVEGCREGESVRLRTGDYVLLPDIHCHRRQGRAPRGGSPRLPRFNWLAIMADPELRSVRDLRARHAPMLERMHRECVEAIQHEHPEVEESDIMVFANYPPSVYRLHFHFCAPFFRPMAFDAFRMHTLSGILDNLRMHPDHYLLSSMRIPVTRGSELERALHSSDGSGGSDSEAHPSGPEPRDSLLEK